MAGIPGQEEPDYNTQGDPSGAVEADTASGGAPEEPSETEGGSTHGATDPAGVTTPEEEDGNSVVPPENPSGG